MTGFASSSALCLFLSIVSHLTSAGTDWAGSVSIASLVVVQSLSVQPSQWFLACELSPVYYMTLSVPLAAAAYWGPSLVTVLLFPLAAQVTFTLDSSMLQLSIKLKSQISNLASQTVSCYQHLTILTVRLSVVVFVVDPA